MSVWADVVDQDAAIGMLRRAASHPDDPSTMTHAWLITGPAGSGRSTLALAFAQALESGTEDPEDRQARMIAAGTHPDVQVLSTSGVTISIDDVRDMVSRAQLSPSMGRFRIQIIEDADRMPETTSNVLLKALEEPPAGTVWILCCPSDLDVLPTIRSRVRQVRLKTPAPEAVAELLHRKWGVEPALALTCARVTQSHVGMARRLATDERARDRRARSLRALLGIRTLHGALAASRALHEIATSDATAGIEEETATRTAELRAQLGLGEGDRVPPAYRAQLRGVEAEAKRRARRAVVDGVDRVLTDAFALFRDVLLTQLGAPVELINVDVREAIQEAASHGDAPQTLARIDAVTTAREQLTRNVSPQLVLDAFCAGLL
jgi:DNA polymerase-3 subunit delta'